jgi:hypothetical protein
MGKAAGKSSSIGSYIKKLLRNDRQRLVLFAAVFAISGVVWLVISSAATTSISVESEVGLPQNGASAVADTNASGGSLIQFGSATASWRPSALVGGGYVNSIAYSPTDDPSNVNNLHVVVVTDVSGIFYSENGGTSWRPANNAATNGGHLRAASVLWHPTTAGLVFAFIGDCSANSGGVLRSTDYGKNWSFVSTTPTACGNQVPSDDGVPKPQPRNIGRLLGIDPQNGFIYAGTYEKGIMRASLSSPGTWQTVALGPGTQGTTQFYIRSLTVDSEDPTTVYASTFNSTVGNAGDGRVWRIKNAHSPTPTIEKLSSSPENTEDLLSLAGNLYAVNAGSGIEGGVHRLASSRSAGASSSFRKLSGPAYSADSCSVAGAYPGSCTVWYSVNGYVSGATTTLWVGASNPPNVGGVYKPFWKATSTSGFSADDGSWTGYPIAKSNVKNDIIGPQGSWWKWNENTWAIPGYENTYDIGDIAVGTSANHPIFAAGQVGIWRSTNGGTDWEPSLDGFLNLVNREVMADPNNPNKVYQTNVDYRMFESNDKLQTVAVSRPSSNTTQDGWSLALDTSTNPTTVYLGLGERDTNTGGQVWTRNSGGTWTQIDAGAFGGLRPTGLGVAKDNGTTVLIAAVQESGIWKKVGSGAWTKLSIASPASGKNIMMNQGSNRADVRFSASNNAFYVYDRDTGLWRGDNFGTTWTRIFTSPGNAESEGYMRVHPTNPAIVFVSDRNGVHKITNANTAAKDAAASTTISGTISNAGAMTLGPNNQLIFVTRPTSSARPRIYTGDYSQTTPTWTDISDDYFRSYAVKVITIDAASDGTLYVSTNNNASIVRD